MKNEHEDWETSWLECAMTYKNHGIWLKKDLALHTIFTFSLPAAAHYFSSCPHPLELSPKYSKSYHLRSELNVTSATSQCRRPQSLLRRFFKFMEEVSEAEKVEPWFDSGLTYASTSSVQVFFNLPNPFRWSRVGELKIRFGWIILKIRLGLLNF